MKNKTLFQKWHIPTIIVVVVLLALWQVASRRFGSYLLPDPLSVLTSFIKIISTGIIWQHVFSTLFRVVIGFALAVVLSIILVLLAYKWKSARIVVKDFNSVFNSISVFIWIVLALIWFGITDSAAIFTTLMVTLPILLSNLLEGLEHVDKRFLEVGSVYQFSNFDEFRNIILPSIFPSFIGGMRGGFGLGLKISVVAEMFGVTTGIGYILNYSREILATDMVFVWAIILIILMIIIDKLIFENLSKKVKKWQY
jgi:ABC-type nitrate/sulfonate/bicarbonate transport system permease component